MSTESTDDYGLSKESALREIPAPALDYQPRNPRAYNPPIGLIGCGGISAHHLRAYSKAGYNVVALCDLAEARAEARRKEFFPDAAVYTDPAALLTRGDIEVVDVATHPHQRLPIIEAAIEAGKHVLSQKPFVLDLDAGERLVELASQKGVKLAVNQNGRWAPHFSYIRQAIEAGLIGDVTSVTLTMNWDHSWIAGTEFEKIHHIILYDFAIHWFDIAAVFFQPRKALRIYAAVSRVPGQTIKPPMLADAVVEFEDGIAALTFNAFSRYGQSDRTVVAGTQGTLHSEGPNLSTQEVSLFTGRGFSKPALSGNWFPDGFHGTMAELLCAIEEDREPLNSARTNLASLALAFAAMASADSGEPRIPGEVRTL